MKSVLVGRELWSWSTWQFSFFKDDGVWEGFVSMIFVRAETFYCRGVEQQLFPPYFITTLLWQQFYSHECHNPNGWGLKGPTDVAKKSPANEHAQIWVTKKTKKLHLKLPSKLLLTDASRSKTQSLSSTVSPKRNKEVIRMQWQHFCNKDQFNWWQPSDRGIMMERKKEIKLSF